MIRGTVTAAQEKGPRRYQEDRFLHIPFHNERTGVHGQLLVVMDGHAHTLYGDTIPDLCCEKIPELFSLEYAYQGQDVLEELVAKLSDLCTDEYHGSTISLALIIESHQHAYFAVLGDSPISIIDESTIKLLPIHNVRSNIDERRLAESRGGTYTSNYIWNTQRKSLDRNPHGLEISRGLGDGCMGEIISRKPDFYECRLPTKSAVLMVTDGVYDSVREDFSEVVEGLTNSTRTGVDATMLMSTKIAHSPLRDNATILLWSTF